MSDQTVNRIDRLRALMAALRDPESGCPWDIRQTFASIAPYTVEEAYEVLEAIEDGDLPGLRDELGDLLLQVLFHARMAEEQGAFDLDDVMDALADKLIRRHPHVFGDEAERLSGEAAVKQAWEARKARERAEQGAGGALDGVARSLPGLTRSLKLQKRAARVGFEWDGIDPVWAKLAEEIEELREAVNGPAPDRQAILHELGDVLTATVNLARKLEIDPEHAMREANRRFERRFAGMEALIRARKLDMAGLSLAQWLELWAESKRRLEETEGLPAKSRA
ncbi:MAG: nucleoside triphosphate pyrophosphohydrolase [Halothiobacillaceae bacterium]